MAGSTKHVFIVLFLIVTAAVIAIDPQPCCAPSMIRIEAAISGLWFVDDETDPYTSRQGHMLYQEDLSGNKAYMRVGNLSSVGTALLSRFDLEPPRIFNIDYTKKECGSVTSPNKEDGYLIPWCAGKLLPNSMNFTKYQGPTTVGYSSGYVWDAVDLDLGSTQSGAPVRLIVAVNSTNPDECLPVSVQDDYVGFSFHSPSKDLDESLWEIPDFCYKADRSFVETDRVPPLFHPSIAEKAWKKLENAVSQASHLEFPTRMGLDVGNGSFWVIGTIPISTNSYSLSISRMSVKPLLPLDATITTSAEVLIKLLEKRLTPTQAWFKQLITVQGDRRILFNVATALHL